MSRFPETIAWLACVVYSTIPLFWLMIHPFANFWRAQRQNPYALLLPLWIALWIGVALLTAPWRQVHFYSLPMTWLPAAALLAIGLWTYRRAGAGFTWSQLAGLPELRQPATPQHLAATGLHARLRHPIYLAHLCEMLAWSLGSGLAACYGLTAVAIATGAVMILTEDRELEQRFGAAYRRYKENVPAIFPRRTPYNPNQLSKPTADSR